MITYAEECEHGSGHGGVHSNGDPYGTLKKLGLPEPVWRFNCWQCWDAFGAKQDAEVAEKVRAALVERGLCGFLEAYIGHCLEAKPCQKHKERCFACGEPATKQCAHTGSLVCGMPECDKHTHQHRGW